MAATPPLLSGNTANVVITLLANGFQQIDLNVSNLKLANLNVTNNANIGGNLTVTHNVYANNIIATGFGSFGNGNSAGMITVNVADANTIENGLGGTWSNLYMIIGQIANTQSPAMGLGYDQTSQTAILAAVRPGVAWEALTIVVSDLRVSNQLGASVSLTGPKWQSVSFGPGVANYGGAYDTAAYYIDATGRVYLRGLLTFTANVKTGNVIVSGLPEPPADICFFVGHQGSGIVTMNEKDMLTNGSFIYAASGGANITSGMFLSLDGLSYQTQ